MTNVNVIIRYTLKADQLEDNIVSGDLVGNAVVQTLTQDLPDTFEEMCENLGDDAVYKLALRMFKVDFSNINREKLKSANGHSTRAVLTEEQKANNKAVRAEKSELFALAESKGLSIDDIKALLG